MSVEGVRILAPIVGEHVNILSPEAIAFLAALHRVFEEKRQERLQARAARQVELDAGCRLDFLPQTAHIREDPTWMGAPPAPGLCNRRVETSGPVDRHTVMKLLNSGAYAYMADFEDQTTPTWANSLDGQVNMKAAIHRTLDYKDENGADWKLRPNEELATPIVRPRSWHLNEEFFLVDAKPIAGGLFDFGLYFFHNAKQLVQNGIGPYFYLPKLESHLEARLWNDIFNFAQDYVDMPRGTIRGTVLIETITATFEMEEIIYELREHSSGLNCGRWDYIFSFIKRQRYNKGVVLPDRDDVTMTVPFMKAYVELLIQVCHKRGVAAIGGMAAQIPIEHDKVANEAARKKVAADKLREAQAGHDGGCVSDPAFVPMAIEIFNKQMPGANQYYVRREDVHVVAQDLLNTNFPGKITEKGARINIETVLVYCANWLRGKACVPINFIVAEAATAEISRISLWQWVYHGAHSDEGRKITPEYIDELIAEEAKKLSELDPKALSLCCRYLSHQIRAKKPSEHLTTDLYPYLDNSASFSKV
ncbi:hypothetical protein CBS9595_002678 [Malassezia furfur]|nr:hypothetical protein CBS9595_002678 [Malassezia furfur]